MPIDSVVRISNYPVAPSSETQNEERNGKRFEQSPEKKGGKGQNNQSTSPETGHDTAQDKLFETWLESQFLDSKKLIDLLSQKPNSPYLQQKIISSYTHHKSIPTSKSQNSVAKKS